jgi:vacuolar-type H+-ATPase subunit E/Vma4
VDALTPAVFAVGAVNLIAFPLLLWFIKRQLERFDNKRDEARKQAEAERRLTIAMARSQLLENYERCMDKGFYTVDEREVYHELYDAYHKDGGNGIMTDLREKIVELPTEPPDED